MKLVVYEMAGDADSALLEADEMNLSLVLPKQFAHTLAHRFNQFEPVVEALKKADEWFRSQGDNDEHATKVRAALADAMLAARNKEPDHA